MIEACQNVFNPQGKVGRCDFATRPLILGAAKELHFGLRACQGHDLTITAAPIDSNNRGRIGLADARD